MTFLEHATDATDAADAADATAATEVVARPAVQTLDTTRAGGQDDVSLRQTPSNYP